MSIGFVAALVRARRLFPSGVLPSVCSARVLTSAATSGFTMGLRLHQSSGSCFATEGSSGHTAPRSIHARSTPICPAVSIGLSLFFGGMSLSPSTPATNWMSGLSALFPGRIAESPESPPLIAASRESRRQPLFCLSGPWQPKQRSCKSGRTSFAKSTSRFHRGRKFRSVQLSGRDGCRDDGQRRGFQEGSHV